MAATCAPLRMPDSARHSSLPSHSVLTSRHDQKDSIAFEVAGSDRHSKRSPSKAIERGEMPLGFLTLRERDAVRRVVKGLLNKQVARELGTSKITVEIRAAHANDGSLFFLADLVRLAEKPDADR